MYHVTYYIHKYVTSDAMWCRCYWSLRLTLVIKQTRNRHLYTWQHRVV